MRGKHAGDAHVIGNQATEVAGAFAGHAPPLGRRIANFRSVKDRAQLAALPRVREVSSFYAEPVAFAQMEKPRRSGLFVCSGDLGRAAQPSAQAHFSSSALRVALV
jgi:hypothetical protein